MPTPAAARYDSKSGATHATTDEYTSPDEKSKPDSRADAGTPTQRPPFFFFGRLVLRCCGRSSSLSSYLFFSAFLLGREDTGAACVCVLLLWSAFCCWTGLEAPARFDDDWEELAGAPAAPPAVPASAAFDVLAFFLEGAMAGAEVVQLLGERERKGSSR